MSQVADYLPLECSIDPLTLPNAFNNPATLADFLTPGYTQPTDASESAWSVKIYVGDTAYEFTWFIVAKSMKFDNRYGEASTCSFTIVTANFDANTNQEEIFVPFVPIPPQLVEIRNISGNKLYFKGYIARRSPKYISRNDSYQEKSHITYTCTDLFFKLQLEKDIVYTYTGDKTTYFIIRDVVRRWGKGLGYSQIDVTKGVIVTDFQINLESPAQVLQRLADLEGLTYRIDPDTEDLLVDTPGSESIILPYTITDANVYDYFKLNLTLDQDYTYIKNDITFWFNEKYSTGAANVAIGSNIVVGYTGTEDWYHIDIQNARFRLLNDFKWYSIKENNSTPDLVTIEIILSDNYNEATATNQPYEIVGGQIPIRVISQSSINSMAQLFGSQTSVWKEVIPAEANTALTFSQARLIAEAYLRMFAYPLLWGKGETSNTRFPLSEFLQAGQGLPFDLHISKGYTGIVILQQVSTSDTGAIRQDIDGNWYPVIEQEVDFSHNMLKMQSQIRRLMQDVRRMTVAQSQTAVLSTYILDESIYFEDCLKVRTGLPIDETVEVSDTIEPRALTGAGEVTWPDVGLPPSGVGGYTLSPLLMSLTVP